MVWLATLIQDTWSVWAVGLAVGVVIGIALGWMIAGVGWRAYSRGRRVTGTEVVPRVPQAASEAYRLMLEKVLSTTPALIVVLDHEGRFVKFNQACVSLTGYEAGEVLGRPFWETVIPHEEREKLRANYKRLVTTVTPRPYENDWIDKQGGRHTVLWSNAVVRGASEADTLVIATGIDVSESRRLQSELIHAQRMDAIGQLAVGISHDFNNLLTAIFGHISLAKRLIPKSHGASASLDRVEQAAGQAGRVIRSLLTFSTNARSERVPTAVASLVAESAVLIEGLLPASIRLVATAPEGDVWIRADRSLIEQALINLAINARDAMPTGGVLTLKAASDDAATAVITVEDTGVGISKESLPRVFEPFFSTKPRSIGVGLGLPVTRSIIVDHAGTLEIQSEPGKGTRVTITIPRCPPVASAAPIKAGGRGLIVASGRAYPRQIMASSLSTLGVPVRTVGDLAALVHELRHGAGASVLVAEVSLIGDGAEVLGLAAGRGVRVLIVGSEAPCSAAWMPTAAMLVEPFSTEQLLAAVQTLAGEAPERSGVVME